MVVVDRFVDRATRSTVQLAPSAARLRGIRAGSAPGASGRASHNPPVVGSSPTRPTGVPSGHIEQLPSGSWRAKGLRRNRPLTGREIRFRKTCKTERADPRVEWEQAADRVRTAIRSGQLTSGDSLPSMPDLAKLQGLKPGTGRLAFLVLAEEGLVYIRHGRTTAIAGEPAADEPGTHRQITRPRPVHDCKLSGCRPHVCTPDQLVARWPTWPARARLNRPTGAHKNPVSMAYSVLCHVRRTGAVNVAVQLHAEHRIWRVSPSSSGQTSMLPAHRGQVMLAGFGVPYGAGFQPLESGEVGH